jgi:hypothetical protein
MSHQLTPQETGKTCQQMVQWPCHGQCHSGKCRSYIPKVTIAGAYLSDSDLLKFGSNNPTWVYKKTSGSSKSQIHRAFEESTSGHRLLWRRVGVHPWGPHGGSIVTSNKGLYGWQVEVVTLPTTAPAKAPWHQLGQSESTQSLGAVAQPPIRWGSHRASHQVLEAKAKAPVPKSSERNSDQLR